jgi:peptidoglycan-associated lipoprotein
MSTITKTIFKAALIGLAVTSLAACASKPVPEPVAPPPAPEPTPAPVPAPTPVPAPVGIIPGSMQDFVVNVGDRVYFDFDAYTLRPDALPVLDAQAAWLINYPAVKVRIEGNADERGTKEYNFALGARRAEAVSTYLVSKGVVPSRIATISYGKENPIDTGTGEDSWAKNRNAHTSLTSGAK